VGVVQCWSDAGERQFALVHSDMTRVVRNLAYTNADGACLVAASSTHVYVWTIATREPLVVLDFSSHGAQVASLAVLPGSTALLALAFENGNEVRVVQLPSGALVRSIVVDKPSKVQFAPVRTEHQDVFFGLHVLPWALAKITL